MFYQPFDRLVGLRIINEFLKSITFIPRKDQFRIQETI